MSFAHAMWIEVLAGSSVPRIWNVVLNPALIPSSICLLLLFITTASRSVRLSLILLLHLYHRHTDSKDITHRRQPSKTSLHVFSWWIDGSLKCNDKALISFIPPSSELLHLRATKSHLLLSPPVMFRTIDEITSLVGHHKIPITLIVFDWFGIISIDLPSVNYGMFFCFKKIPFYCIALQGCFNLNIRYIKLFYLRENN